MASVTLAEMRTVVADRADVAGSSRVTSAKIDAQINKSIRKLHARLVEASEDDFTTSIDRVVTSDGEPTVLTEFFYKLREIEWMPGAPTAAESSYDVTSIKPVPLVRFQLQERARYGQYGAWSSGSPIAYRLIGRAGVGVSEGEVLPTARRLYFLPVPTTDQLVRVWYVANPTALSGDADNYDADNGCDDWVCWDAAIAILIGEESDARQASEERDRVWQEMIAPTFATRDEARPDRVIDADGDFYREEFGA
jgi:hypothetical protein